VLRRFAIVLLALLVAQAGVASCVCRAEACPMAEAEAGAGEPAAMMDCCAGSGPAGIASASDCAAPALEQPERIAEALPCGPLAALGVEAHVARPPFETPAGLSLVAAVHSPDEPPPDTLIALHTSLVR
jgi:hypothetical protein